MSSGLFSQVIPRVGERDRGASGHPAAGMRVCGLPQVENIFFVPVKVNSADCMLVIYGRTGNGATDNETQVKALMVP